MIKFVSDLRLVGGFSPNPLVSSTNKTDRHDIPITEILLKVALITIIRANVIILELSVINVICLVSSDTALLTGCWTC